MTLLKISFIFLIVLFTVNSTAQKPVINILDSGKKTSLRGLSVVDDSVVWASGSNGKIARSTNGGKSFKWLTVQGYEKRDFRDIEAFDANTALIMAVAEPAIILKTKDGGKTWKKAFEDTTKGMFLDAMDFDNSSGIVVGDPIENKIYIAFTNNYGESWQKLAYKKNILYSTEGMFAASGTNVKLLSQENKSGLNEVLVTGGKKSRLFYKGSPFNLDIIQGEESQGANSVAINLTRDTIIVVGGDFKNDTSKKGNCDIISVHHDSVLHIKPITPPHGYRSCVEYITKDKLINCGTSGVDISNDGGMNWELISTKSFHVCKKAKQGNKLFLAGANGKIAILSYQ